MIAMFKPNTYTLQLTGSEVASLQYIAARGYLEVLSEIVCEQLWEAQEGGLEADRLYTITLQEYEAWQARESSADECWPVSPALASKLDEFFDAIV